MNVVKIIADAEGHSHFADEDWSLREGEFTPPSPAGYLVTDTMAAAGVLMMHHPAGYRDAWHTAPIPVLGTVLRGDIRILTSDGDERCPGPGNQFIAADTTGRGHKMVPIDEQAYDLCLVLIDDAVQADAGTDR